MLSEECVKILDEVMTLVERGLTTDGVHHKQWYLEQIYVACGGRLESLENDLNWEQGIAP